jgi:hypothetical protein
MASHSISGYSVLISWETRFVDSARDLEIADGCVLTLHVLSEGCLVRTQVPLDAVDALHDMKQVGAISLAQNGRASARIASRMV